jgi:hypothetical protein
MKKINFTYFNVWRIQGQNSDAIDRFRFDMLSLSGFILKVSAQQLA